MWQSIDSQEADDFVKHFGGSEFLQSSAWLDIQSQFYTVDTLGYYWRGQLVAVARLIRRPLWGKFCYYYSPRGPIVKQTSEDLWPQLINDLRSWLKKGRALFWRIEPGSYWINYDFFSLGVYRGPDTQPSETRILSLDCPAEELLSKMHPKTRYNIRLASKRGVTVRQGGRDDFASLWSLLLITSKRDNFHLHRREYYLALINSPAIKFLIAEYHGQVLAAGIFAYWGDMAIYLHGASGDKHRELMAPYALQWQAIKLAYDLGARRYDLFGISSQKWPGVTRFKQGFGGDIIHYPGTFDWPFFKGSYNIYTILRHWRRRKH